MVLEIPGPILLSLCLLYLLIIGGWFICPVNIGSLWVLKLYTKTRGQDVHTWVFWDCSDLRRRSNCLINDDLPLLHWVFYRIDLLVICRERAFYMQATFIHHTRHHGFYLPFDGRSTSSLSFALKKSLISFRNGPTIIQSEK